MTDQVLVMFVGEALRRLHDMGLDTFRARYFSNTNLYTDEQLFWTLVTIEREGKIILGTDEHGGVAFCLHPRWVSILKGGVPRGI